MVAGVAAVALAATVGGLAYGCSASGGSSSPGTPAAPSAPATFPLTGLPTGGQASATRPALSVKIDNAGPAHPQSGLNAADIVSEQLVEGGVTRLLAVYQSTDAAAVGPIRSARPVDAALLRQLGGGIFAFSGAAAGELAPVKASSDAVLLSGDQLGAGAGRPFTRTDDRRPPYNLYSSTARLYAAGYARAAARRPPPPVFAYGPAPASATPATSASMAFSAYSSRSWAWDPASRLWVRSENGRRDVLASGQPVTATDVVVLSVATRPIPGLVDAAGNNDQDITLTGSGPCWVLRGGTVTTGRWTRTSLADAGRLTDRSGRPIRLAPGRTWIELLPRPHQPVLTR